MKYYDKLEDFIKNRPGQLKIEIGKRKDYFYKYILFFKELNNLKLVKKYVYQWMTNRKYDEIMKNSDKEKKKLQEPTFFEFFPFHKDLIN